MDNPVYLSYTERAQIERLLHIEAQKLTRRQDRMSDRIAKLEGERNKIRTLITKVY